MPRAGLTVGRVTTAAAELADEVGFERLSLSGLARRLGVADPSLYSHVASLADLRAKVSGLARAELAARLSGAVGGRAGRDALGAYASAYRGYAVDHPGRMAAVEEPPAPTTGDGGDGARIVTATYATFRAYGLREPDLTDAVRLVRATLHGFTDLERRAQFHDPAPVDATFERVVDALDAALAHWPARPAGPTVTRHRCEVPGASLHYELRGAGPALLLLGAPAGCATFAPLADALADDHLVVTVDPRGIGDSTRENIGDLTPEALAADVVTLLDGLGAGPVAVFGVSGGANVGLELASSRPDLVAGLVAFEPPLLGLLPDGEEILRRAEAARATFLTSGPAAAMPQLQAALFGREAPAGDDDGAGAGDDDGAGPPGDDGVGDTGEAPGDVVTFLTDLLLPTLRHRPGPGAPGLVVARGAESAGEPAHRAATALAQRSGRPLIELPGGHLGSVTHPRATADRLRAVLGRV